jgi:glycosyltransferase involved in cell wall biosynthesis
VVAVSHATADDLLRLGVVDEERLVVVPPGAELEAHLALEGRSGILRRMVGAGDEVVLVGVIGRLAEVKRPGWALDVFETLAGRYPALQLVFVGDGDQRRMLERRITALSGGLAERVHLIGAVEDVVPILADLDAVLATSRSEGMPVALIEAGAAGLPVVATPVGGTAEVVARDRTGFLGETPDELAYGLAQLLDDPRLGPAMGRRARLRVAERHGARGLADRLEALYEAVCEERRCAS